MKSITPFLLFFALVILIRCSPTPGESLIAGDEFNYAGAPDSTKWNFELGDGCPDICGWGNNEIEIYTSDASNVRVENGNLVIEARRDSNRWTSARLTSRSKIKFTHGRIEFRAKLPSGIGTWPALWMLGESIGTAHWPACGEIDVMEHIGKNPGIVQSVIHTAASYGNTLNKDTIVVANPSTEFHVYQANWSSDKIEFSVDGQKYYTYQPLSRTEANWPFDKDLFIIMNIAMGGNLGGPIDPKLQKATMEVDYVRIYKN